jgi:hypothetical protein
MTGHITFALLATGLLFIVVGAAGIAVDRYVAAEDDLSLVSQADAEALLAGAELDARTEPAP